MKALVPTLGFFVLFIIVFNDSMAQKVSHTTNGGWTVGFGAGTSYQKSDLVNSRGFGLDLALGSQLYHKENAFLSIDWKFRFLAGQNKAYDHRINPENTYSNIQYNFFNYDLELGLTLNRIRERTGIVLTGFAGAGITFGRTYTDLYDSNNNLYDFGVIDPNRDSKLVYKDLVALSDGDFETSLVKKAALLPTAGIFIGYQLNRSLILGIEYKTNFYLTENNGFFGIDLDNKIIAGSGIDRNNYVTLGLRWNLKRAASTRGATVNYTSDASNYYGHPSVNITEPSTESYRTVSRNQTILATINNVSGPDNIRFSQNGFPVNGFTYNLSTKTFVADVSLRDGENSFILEATNQLSAAEDQVIITLDSPPEAPDPAPWVAYNSRTENQHTVHLIEPEKRDNHQVQVVNPTVPVVLKINEPVYNEPVYNEPVYNEPVYNEPVYNEPAYHKPVRRSTPPEIRIISPLAYPFRTYDQFGELRATVINVYSKENIILKINGSNTRDFNYNSSTSELTARVALREGENVLTIQAQNNSGGDMKDQVFVKVTRPCRPPVIRLIDPAGGRISTNQQIYTFRANVRNFTNIRELRLSVNGKSVSFTSDNNQISSSIPLLSGPNTLSLKAENECGESDVSAEITYIPAEEVIAPCTPPIVSFTLNEVNRENTTYELRGSVAGVNNRADISLSLDGKTTDGFQFIPSTGDLAAKFKLTPGSHTAIVTVSNACGADSRSESVTVEEEVEASGIRFNPGNSSWQFCLATPSGTYTRENLTNSNFSYSGAASSLYFMPIGGGGDAMVNGRPYTINPGQYYHFTGILNVTVSNRNPGSMGHWSVCIIADRAPAFGNGNNRPKCPCEVDNNESKQGNRNNNNSHSNSNYSNDNNSNGNSNSNSSNRNNSNRINSNSNSSNSNDRTNQRSNNTSNNRSRR